MMLIKKEVNPVSMTLEGNVQTHTQRATCKSPS